MYSCWCSLYYHTIRVVDNHSMDGKKNKLINYIRSWHQRSIIYQVPQTNPSIFWTHHKRKIEKLEKLSVQVKVEGRRAKGRSPSCWLHQIKNITGQSLQIYLSEGEDRHQWRIRHYNCKVAMMSRFLRDEDTTKKTNILIQELP